MNNPNSPMMPFAAGNLLTIETPLQSPLVSPMMSPCPTSPPISGGKSGNLFVHKLHHMIFDPTYQSLISWSFNGSSFIVCNIQEFSKDVLPKHFKHNNFSSFIRQLNMYSFTKTNKSPRGSRTPPENQVWEFSHPKFHRDHQEQLDDMKRKAADVNEMNGKPLSNTAFVSQLQSQLSQVLISLQSMQEQFTEVVRELNDVKRKSAIHQLMMKNVLEFLNKNMNDSDPAFSEMAKMMENQASPPALQSQSSLHGHSNSLDSVKMDLGSLFPSEVGDTMEINVSIPQVSTIFSPTNGVNGQVFSPTNVDLSQATSPFMTQPASPYIAPSSPYIAPSQGGFLSTAHSPFQMQSPFQQFDSRASFNNFAPQMSGMGNPMRNMSIG